MLRYLGSVVTHNERPPNLAMGLGRLAVVQVRAGGEGMLGLLAPSSPKLRFRCLWGHRQLKASAGWG